MLINGVAAPLYSVSGSQINVQVPWEVQPGMAEVVVVRGGDQSNPALIEVVEARPSLFTLAQH